ncbi:MAG: hypothetical protein AABY22_06265, partial [Nanoarchaeota archaeon]
MTEEQKQCSYCKEWKANNRTNFDSYKEMGYFVQISSCKLCSNILDQLNSAIKARDNNLIDSKKFKEIRYKLLEKVGKNYSFENLVAS